MQLWPIVASGSSLPTSEKDNEKAVSNMIEEDKIPLSFLFYLRLYKYVRLMDLDACQLACHYLFSSVDCSQFPNSLILRAN